MGEMGKAIGLLISGTLVYHHCANRNATLLSLFSDVLIVLLSSLAILGLLFRQLNVSVPVDPLEWQISQDTASNIFARLANTVGAAESVLRVAATGHDKRLFLKVVISLYFLAALGRIISGMTIAYAGLCLFCLYMACQNSQSTGNSVLNRTNRETSE
ncbi:reticulon-like protein B22 [Brassica rapa]|uniref:reticulon-like protein B22 n=1 Tax=Brassica campestris TaxID=3711 RepID=UPI0004F18C25|nr:reticulon-like protein B22 [Brassica rapa]XP_022547590.1 reticulon-like protein B22 [Brassica napus]